jgi:SAM-dependent methyltransferase
MERRELVSSLGAVLESIRITPGPRSVLVPGSGPGACKEWEDQGFKITRLDIESRNKPDVVGSMVAMGEIGPFDVVYCCHALEHLYPHEVNRALSEFKRVLKPGGAAVVVVPDLEDVKPNNDVLEYPDSGAITGLHLFYGDHREIEQFPYMAHHCGFIAETMKFALEQAGFGLCQALRESHHNLVGIGIKIG